ncbi:hypothetical protein X963_5424 [Burkholderia pseudomallei MSHR7498]|nr:hypothetical protein X963_5424 [Burkholderia pseudomallei MSHR7498]VUD58988.1 unnamed protein product [Burkholderia pseudomallei]
MRRRRDSPKPFESKRPAHLIQLVITSEMHRFNSRTMARRDFLKNNFQPMSSAQY